MGQSRDGDCKLDLAGETKLAAARAGHILPYNTEVQETDERTMCCGEAGCHGTYHRTRAMILIIKLPSAQPVRIKVTPAESHLHVRPFLDEPEAANHLIRPLSQSPTYGANSSR
jgi:hypothetical protein